MNNLIINKNVVYTKKNDIEYIQFEKLLQYKEINHCITLRTGDMDFCTHNDYKKHQKMITNNYKRICDVLNLDYCNIVRGSQAHTDNIKIINNKQFAEKPDMFTKKLQNIDALITSKQNIILSTTHADCTPLFFFDPVKKIIANVHSGWKGTLNKIGYKTVKQMITEYNCNPKDIICAIGPCIRKCHFEVKDDVKSLIEEEFKYTGKINEIVENINDNYYIDLVLINKLMLQEIGLSSENIIDCDICTVCNKDQFYSFRGDGELKGLMTGLITMVE